MSARRQEESEVPRGEILNLTEAARFLGVSTKTFQKVLREGEIPGRKVGREWKFSRRALTDWIGAGRSRDFLDAADARSGSDAARLDGPLRGRPDGRHPARTEGQSEEMMEEEG